MNDEFLPECGYRCRFTREQHYTNERIRHPFMDRAPREGLDPVRLAEAMRGVLDTTTRERVLPYVATIVAEYDRLGAAS